MLFEVKFESGFTLEGLVAFGAIHLSFGVSGYVSNVRSLDGSLKVALFAPM
jgi:hypothetical protein